MKSCTVIGCGNKHLANGLCNKHYAQVLRNGKITDITRNDPNVFIEKGEFVVMQCRDTWGGVRCEVLLDKEAVDICKGIKWHNRAGYIVGYVYVPNKTAINMHDLIMDHKSDDTCVDHINRNPLDNRKSNLRVVSFLQNRHNSGIPKNNKSGYKGVFWDKARGKWASQFVCNKKYYYLGTFESKESAATAYNEKIKELQGPHAFQNIIKETTNGLRRRCKIG